MEIRAKATRKGPAESFTGDVTLDVVKQPDDVSTTSIAAVHFDAGARTAWHSHRGGQTLYVTEGEGRVQSRGEAKTVIRRGDVIETPSGEWHWHGAAPAHAMTHLSITHGPATWGEHVTDEEYLAGE
jgi:quercetin dioxygenase-like cupin family protein